MLRATTLDTFLCVLELREAMKGSRDRLVELREVSNPFLRPEIPKA